MTLPRLQSGFESRRLLVNYIGGKHRLSRYITAYLPDGKYYLEPFLGGGSSFAANAPNYEVTLAGDVHLDLMLMYKALVDGWQPPEVISEEQYQQLRYDEPSALRGLVGFASSFGGKWFGGYARGKTAKGESRNYLSENVRNLARITPTMKDTYLAVAPYWSWRPQKDWVVYCDPPYADTQKFNSTDSFDSKIFWLVAESWVHEGAKVFVSEYHAPEHWKLVEEFNHRTSLSLQGEDRVERLWTYKGGK